MIVEFAASSTIRVEYDEKVNTKRLLETKIGFKTSQNINGEAYFLPDGMPNADGYKTISTVLLNGVVSNIHAAHQSGLWDSSEHFRFVIAEMEKLFVETPDLKKG